MGKRRDFIDGGKCKGVLLSSSGYACSSSSQVCRVIAKRNAPVTTPGWYEHAPGEFSLAQLKKLVEGTGPIFDWAIGWLAREGKVVLTTKKRSFSIRLK